MRLNGVVFLTLGIDVQWLKTLALIVTLLLAGMMGALAVNQEQVALSFAIWTTPFELEIFWWLLAAFLVGLLVGLINASWVGLKRRVENRRLRQSLDQANAELNRLRSLET